MSMQFAFAPGGTIALPSQHALEDMDADNAIFTYSNGKTEDGGDYYAYIAVRPSLYAEFRSLSDAHAPMDLSAYGEILAFGFASEPPYEVVQRMRQEYGCDPDFEINLTAEVLRQQAVFLKKQEEDRIAGIVNMLKIRKPS